MRLLSRNWTVSTDHATLLQGSLLPHSASKLFCRIRVTLHVQLSYSLGNLLLLPDDQILSVLEHLLLLLSGSLSNRVHDLLLWLIVIQRVARLSSTLDEGLSLLLLVSRLMNSFHLGVFNSVFLGLLFVHSLVSSTGSIAGKS